MAKKIEAAVKAKKDPDLLYGMDEITDLMGYAKIAELEAQFLPDEQLARKYGTGEVDYVVRKPQA